MIAVSEIVLHLIKNFATVKCMFYMFCKYVYVVYMQSRHTTSVLSLLPPFTAPLLWPLGIVTTLGS